MPISAPNRVSMRPISCSQNPRNKIMKIREELAALLSCAILVPALASNSVAEELFSEDFESIVLGESVDEGLFQENVWSDTPPDGWVVDSTDVAGIDEEGVGVTEWKGWNFADAQWWAETAGDQRRSEFALDVDGNPYRGTVAIADPDEWDDTDPAPSGLGTFNSFLKSPAISLEGVAPNAVSVGFDSSFRPEGNQRATVTVSYDDGESTLR